MVAIKVQFVLTLFVGTALASPLANPLEVRDRVCYLYIFFIISLPPDSSPVDSLPQKHGRYPYVLALKYIYIYINPSRHPRANTLFSKPYLRAK